MEPQTVAAPQTTNNVHGQLVPDSWPGGFGIFKFSKTAFKVNLGVNLILVVLSFVLQISVRSRSHINSLLLFSGLIAAVVGILFGAAQKVAALASAREQKISFSQAFPKDAKIYLNYFVLSILTAVTEFVSLLLLIIPFFFVYPRLALAPYYLIDKNLGPIEAYKASWHGTKTHKGKVWGIVGVTFLFAILCLVLVGFYLLIVYSMASVLLYLYVTKQPATENLGTAAQSNPVAGPNPTPETPVSSAPQDQQPQPPVTPTTPPQV